MKADTLALDLSGLAQFKASQLLDEPAAGGAPLRVALETIDFDAGQPRRTMNEATLAELAEAIRVQGVLEPVSLRTDPDKPGRYIVNRGERRVRASRLAGLRDVPAFIDERVDPFAQAAENLHREDMTPFDLAEFVAAREREGVSRAEIARRLGMGKRRSFITEVASLAGAPAQLRAAFDAGRIANSRTLYQIALAARERPALAGQLLAGNAPITREGVEALLAPPPAAAEAGAAPRGRARARSAGRGGSRAAAAAGALVVEHEGRRGRLAWGAPGKRSGEVVFDDGSRKMVPLARLSLIAWAAR